jgi:hypothetical protein
MHGSARRARGLGVRERLGLGAALAVCAPLAAANGMGPFVLTAGSLLCAAAGGIAGLVAGWRGFRPGSGSAVLVATLGAMTAGARFLARQAPFLREAVALFLVLAAALVISVAFCASAALTAWLKKLARRET